MGREKVLLPLAGESLVRRSVRAAGRIGAAEILVLVNPHNQANIELALAGLPCTVVCNSRYAEGIGCSIATAAAAVRADADALLLLQADQPLVDAGVLQRIIDAWRAARPPYVAASFGGTTTTPVLFARTLFEELRALGGDTGARTVLCRHAGSILDFPPWQGRDVDTEGDYEGVQTLVKGAAEVPRTGKVQP